jgi:hypothetical protein
MTAPDLLSLTVDSFDSADSFDEAPEGSANSRRSQRSWVESRHPGETRRFEVGHQDIVRVEHECCTS